MRFQLQCPATGQSFSAQIEIDGQVVARYWGRQFERICPLCREPHGFDFKQHYIAAAAVGDGELALTTGC
jgi:hypothetical protein